MTNYQYLLDELWEVPASDPDAPGPGGVDPALQHHPHARARSPRVNHDAVVPLDK